MFLLVSARLVGAYPGERQHGASYKSLQFWVKHFFGYIYIYISYMKYSSNLNLGEGLCICTSYHFPDSGLYVLNGFDFYFDLF